MEFCRFNSDRSVVDYIALGFGLFGLESSFLEQSPYGSACRNIFSLEHLRSQGALIFRNQGRAYLNFINKDVQMS